MYGLTNSANVTIESGTGDGNIVYAADDTNTGIVSGKKYWLTRRHLGEIDATYYQEQASGSFWFFMDYTGNFYQVNPSLWGRHWFDEEGVHHWEQIGSAYIAGSVPTVFRRRCGRFYASNMNTTAHKQTFFLNYMKQLDISEYLYLGRYKGCEYALKHSDESTTHSIYAFDVEKGAAYGPEICSFTTTNGATWYAALDEDGNMYLSHDSDNSCEIYDVSGVLDKTAAAPVLLSVLNLTHNEGMLEGGYTGFGNGDYLFGLAKLNTSDVNLYGGCTLSIYRLNADRELTSPVNLPQKLQDAIGTEAYIVFDNDTGILTLGTNTEVSAYIWDKHSKTFTEIELELELPTVSVPASDKCYALYLSADMTRAAVTYNYASFAPTYQLYQFQVSDGAWHATERYVLGNNMTVTGVATGEVDDAGQYAFKTYLPGVAALTLQINPDPDVFEFKGEAK